MISGPWISVFQPFPAQPSFATVFSFHFWKLLNNTSFLPFSWLNRSSFWKANDTHHSLFPSLPHHLLLCPSDRDYNSTSMQPKMLSLTDLLGRTLAFSISPVNAFLTHCFICRDKGHIPDTSQGIKGRCTPKQFQKHPVMKALLHLNLRYFAQNYTHFRRNKTL